MLWEELFEGEGEKSEGETNICCQFFGCSSETDWVNIILAVIFKELNVILHITPLCSLLHTLLKDKFLCLQGK